MNNKPGAIIIEGHVQGLSNTRSLGESGIPVYIVDKTNCIARYSKYCKKFFKSPDFIKDEFVKFLITLADKESIKDWVLIPSNDHAVYTISKHKKVLENHYKVITPGLNIIEKIYDKTKLLQIAKKNHIPVPITQTFSTPDDNISEELKFPVLTKGRNGLSFYKTVGKKAFLAKNEAELRKQLEYIQKHYDIEKTFTQELIPLSKKNNTISFTAFCDHGEIKTHWEGVKIREHPIQFGTATFTKSIHQETCHQQSEKLLKALNYTGVCEVEYLRDPRSGEYKLIEINPRTWLWVGLAKDCGVDYAKMIYDFMYGKTIDWPHSYKTDIYWINSFSDFVYSIVAIMKGQLSLKEFFSSIISKRYSNALYKKGDLLPGLVYLLSIFSFLKHR